MGDFRFGFRMAGMMAEIDYLGRSKFTGEAHYWREGEELRRELKICWMPPRPSQNGRSERDVLADNAFCAGAFREWMESTAKRIAIFFSSGKITKIEG